MWIISILDLILSGNIQTQLDYYSPMMYRILLRIYESCRVKYLLPNEFGHFYSDSLLIFITVLKRNKVLSIQKKNMALTSQRQQGTREKEAFAFPEKRGICVSSLIFYPVFSLFEMHFGGPIENIEPHNFLSFVFSTQSNNDK